MQAALRYPRMAYSDCYRSSFAGVAISYLLVWAWASPSATGYNNYLYDYDLKPVAYAAD